MARDPSVRVGVAAPWRWRATSSQSARRAAMTIGGRFAQQLEATNRCQIIQQGELEQSTRRTAALGGPTVTVEAASGDLIAIAAYHPSRAVTLHLPTSKTVRRGGPARTESQVFEIPVSAIAGPRRGFLGRAISIVVFKIIDAMANQSLPALLQAAERRWWRSQSGAPLGWVHVTRQGLAANSLKAVSGPVQIRKPPARNLLFLHGTFSSTAGAFGDLARNQSTRAEEFWTTLQHLYGDAVFGFNHFSVSKSPKDNAGDLLADLPSYQYLFDVVTHSRGGLVARYLTEHLDQFPGAASKFCGGRVVLVASPNEGTPLAAPGRLLTLASWLATLVDCLGLTGPISMAVDFIAESLNWLAKKLPVALPGVDSMDPQGQVVRFLERGTPGGAEYAALVADFQPTGNWLARLADVGVDALFGMPNDLVVPTEGGWKLSAGRTIQAARVGSFGTGGNLGGAPDAVYHNNFFQQDATCDFLQRTLRGDATRQASRAGTEAEPRRTAVEGDASGREAIQPEVTIDSNSDVLRSRGTPSPLCGDVFQIAIFSTNQEQRDSFQLLATYRNARVLETLRAHGDEAGQRWKRIIAMQERIQAFIDGVPDAQQLPHGEELLSFGDDLFQTLLPGKARRLYDGARASQGSRRLNIVFTSAISWIADKPWEFAYDASRRTFLATEEANFVRNVGTAVPADSISRQTQGLQILVAVAQPLNLPHLSYAEEIAVIREGFKPLIDARLATVDVLLNATPRRLHERLLYRSEPYDVLHFIGHGEFSDGAQHNVDDLETDHSFGYLVFETSTGQRQLVDSATVRLLIARRDIRLVFLNACETGKGGRIDFNRGVAPALVAGGVPAVVANQYSVLDSSATAFSQQFYHALARGYSLGDAAREARVALNYAMGSDVIDWAVPVIFSRDPSESLCVPLPKDREVTAPPAPPAAPLPTDRFCVAIWDVQATIPYLDQIVERMNRAQSYYHFFPVHLTAPLGIWQRRRTNESSYLLVDQVLERLASKPQQVGADNLLCITTMPMQVGSETDLYWYGEDEHLSFFSVAGFLDKLNPPFTTLERLVANACVTALANLAPHNRRPYDCPSYYNPERDIRWVAGPLKFCAACRRQFKQSEQDRLAALDAILESFA